MRFFVAVTENDWYSQLAEKRPDEVNFWRPSGAGFQALEVGGLFLFKLHSPLNFIAGGGFFLRYSKLPVSLTWDAFGWKNGVRTVEALLERIRKLNKRATAEPDPEIGNIILTEPFFLPREKWIPLPANYPMNAVQGKGYDSADPDGAEIWLQVMDALAGDRLLVAKEESSRYGEALVRRRLGQGGFRVEVTEVYQRRCAISGERTLPVLQAAHIRPFSKEGPNLVSNGLCLRADMHLLFDQGLLTVTPEYRVEVSPKIKERYENGRDYYAHHGQELQVLPASAEDLPAPEFLSWHNENVFVA